MNKTTTPKIVEPTVFPFQMAFLDTVIHNSGNSDGFVPVTISPYHHLGNYRTLKDAMGGAFLYFLINHPDTFSSCVFHRLIGSGTYHEWFTFTRFCEEKNIEIPDTIFCSNDTNFTIETAFENALRKRIK